VFPSHVIEKNRAYDAEARVCHNCLVPLHDQVSTYCGSECRDRMADPTAIVDLHHAVVLDLRSYLTMAAA
jgi:hypothetical protein